LKKESLYLDTSVPSAYYDERAKERQDSTIKFWKDVLPNYKVYVSEITVKELDNTKDETLKKKFRDLTKNFKVLKVNKKIRDLAGVYIEKGIFPEKYIDDALHVAIASYHEISYMISWNFEIWLR
jgi:predicted nucleic acid-binding protein